VVRRIKKGHGQSPFVRDTRELDFFMRGGTDKLVFSMGKKSTDKVPLSVAPVE
jgi:hypothetical protein